MILGYKLSVPFEDKNSSHCKRFIRISIKHDTARHICIIE